ncbi:MAG: hypothetical protein GSR73_00980 [Desulfurococcales archaeon]|nr:hypothetical protein [Desulfurococcales archaeon]
MRGSSTTAAPSAGDSWSSSRRFKQSSGGRDPQITGYILEEEVFDNHYRVVKIRSGDWVLYSIDVYKLLPKAVECDDKLVEGPVTLCYKRVDDCVLTVSMVNDRVELVNIRLQARADEDPAGGSPSRAREYCLGRVKGLLEEWLRRGSAG